MFQRIIYSIKRLFIKEDRTFGVPRSPKWSEVRNTFIKTHPTCEACGSTKHLQIHHVVAFHTDMEKELDPSNLMTLCEGMECNCHRMIGHLGNFQSINESVREDAKNWLEKINNRPSWNGAIWKYPHA